MPQNANIDSINVRRACPLARELFYLELMDQAHNYPHMVYMGGCVTCGQPTGNFCDPCVNAALYHYTASFTRSYTEKSIFSILTVKHGAFHTACNLL